MVPASQLYTCIRSTKHTEGLLGKAGQIRLVTGRFRTSFIFENLHVPHLVDTIMLRFLSALIKCDEIIVFIIPDKMKREDCTASTRSLSSGSSN